MIFKIRSTDLGAYGYAIVPVTKLLVIYFTQKSIRKPDILSGHEYPHISMYCSNLTVMNKAYGTEITAQFDSFHISFDSSGKVWKLVTPGTPPLISSDNTKNSATLGVTATVDGETWTVDDICTKFLQPILTKRVA